MQIELLANNLSAIATIAEWYRVEWEPYYGQDGPGDALIDLEARCNDAALPIGLVATEAGGVLGTIALDIDQSTNLSPSVVGLFVKHDQRHRGVATALLDAVEARARHLGFERLYMSTIALRKLLVRRDWQPIGEVQFINDEQGAIFTKDLRAHRYPGDF